MKCYAINTGSLRVIARNPFEVISVTNGQISHNNVSVVEEDSAYLFSTPVNPIRKDILSVPGSSIVDIDVTSSDNKCEYKMTVTKSNGDSYKHTDSTEDGVTSKVMAILSALKWAISSVQEGNIIAVFDNKDFDDVLVDPYYLNSTCNLEFTQSLKHVKTNIDNGRLRLLKVNPLKDRQIVAKPPIRLRHEV